MWKGVSAVTASKPVEGKMGKVDRRNLLVKSPRVQGAEPVAASGGKDPPETGRPPRHTSGPVESHEAPGPPTTDSGRGDKKYPCVVDWVQLVCVARVKIGVVIFGSPSCHGATYREGGYSLLRRAHQVSGSGGRGLCGEAS